MDSDKTTRIHSDYTLFALLKPRIFIDGNKWIVLYGENIQDGVAGCGDSPHEAVLDFNQNWNKKLPAIGGSEDFIIN